MIKQCQVYVKLISSTLGLWGVYQLLIAFLLVINQSFLGRTFYFIFMELSEGWYAKEGKKYYGKKNKPFESPWEVFNEIRWANKTAYIKGGREVIVLSYKSRPDLFDLKR